MCHQHAVGKQQNRQVPKDDPPPPNVHARPLENSHQIQNLPAQKKPHSCRRPPSPVSDMSPARRHEEPRQRRDDTDNIRVDQTATAYLTASIVARPVHTETILPDSPTAASRNEHAPAHARVLVSETFPTFRRDFVEAQGRACREGKVVPHLKNSEIRSKPWHYGPAARNRATLSFGYCQETL